MAAVAADAGGWTLEGVFQLPGGIDARARTQIDPTRHGYLLLRRLLACIIL
jgi:hypothetical protein